jgi:hypothetical protein
MRELNDKRGVHYGPATNPQIMPYLTELPNDRSPHGLWLLVIVSGNVPDPGEYDLSEDLEEKRHMMHGHTIQLKLSLLRAGSCRNAYTCPLTLLRPTTHSDPLSEEH